MRQQTDWHAIERVLRPVNQASLTSSGMVSSSVISLSPFDITRSSARRRAIFAGGIDRTLGQNP
jgi:hypothetical protein